VVGTLQIKSKPELIIGTNKRPRQKVQPFHKGVEKPAQSGLFFSQVSMLS
jgi:hypothetical protein